MAKDKSRGLGDLTAKLAKFTGAEALVKSVLGEDCGCDERQELMNELLPFNTDTDGVDEDVLYNKALSLAFVRDLMKSRDMGKRITKEQFMLFWDIYREYVNPRKANTSCRKCVNNSINEVERVLCK